jgi:hypothetical protein
MTAKLTYLRRAKGVVLSKKQATRYNTILTRTVCLPPPFISWAFGIVKNGKTDEDNLLYHIFNCECAFMEPAKHLEQFGFYFDFFRHSLRLPVILEKINVGGLNLESKSPEWYKSLKYPRSMSMSEESLFLIRENPVPVLTEVGKKLLKEKYYAPKVTNHPLIDPVFTARQGDGEEECFVLIQNKLNKDVPKAVDDLNKAANLI